MIPKTAAEQHGFKVLDDSEGSHDALIVRLKEILPSAITEDGRVDVGEIRNAVGIDYTIDNGHRYELRFPGKGMANHIAGLPTNSELRVEHNQSKDFDKTSNVMIRGDNIDVLKILRQNYHNSIKMIYIDPPYNRENDEFVYNDDFKKNEAELIEELGLDPETVERFQDLYGTKTHSGWLAFMYPRLKIARELLADDGVILISIDDNEHSNLKLLCNEIFSEANFIGNVVWEGGRKNDAKFLSIATDYILTYAKNLSLMKENHTTWRLRKDGIDLIYKKTKELKHLYGNDYRTATEELRLWYKNLDKKNPAWKHRHYNSIDERGVYFPGDISWPGGGGPRYEILHPLTGKPVKIPKRGWVFPDQNKMNEHIAENRVDFGSDETSVPNHKRYLRETEGQTIANVYYKDRRAAKKALDSLLAENVFDDPKDVEVIGDMTRAITQKSDIILDFFAGSGTTGETVMRLNAEDGNNRRFILVQIDEDINKKKIESIEFCNKNNLNPVISSITIERLRRAGNAIKTENPDADTGFRVFSLKPRPRLMTDESQTQLLSVQRTDRSPADTLFNMLCATGKPLDTSVKEIVKDTLYEADDEMYVLGNTDLSDYNGRKINVDGWGEGNTLEQYLNLPDNDTSIIY